MWNQAASCRAEKRHSIKSRIFLVFVVYSAFNALLDSIANQLSGNHFEEQLNRRQDLSLMPSHCIGGDGTSTTTLYPNHNDLINETLSHRSHDNEDDCIVGENKSLDKDVDSTASSWWLSLSKEHRLVGKIIATQLRWRAVGGGRSAFWAQVEAIRLVRLDAPNFIEAGQPVRLRCVYETRGDKLQSLSWYRNGHEFYRYQPFERRQPVLAFNYTGVTVDLSKSRNSTVFLTNTTSETSGRYKCEATATNFQEVNMETYVTVVTHSLTNNNLLIFNYKAVSDAASKEALTVYLLAIVVALSTFTSFIIL